MPGHMEVSDEMRNPEAVMTRILKDTGYTTICPGCAGRTGKGRRGVRALKLEVCQPCAAKRKDGTVKSLKHMGLGVVGR